MSCSAAYYYRQKAGSRHHFDFGDEIIRVVCFLDEEIVKQESYPDSYVAELDIPYSDVSEAEDKTVTEISAEHKVTGMLML